MADVKQLAINIAVGGNWEEKFRQVSTSLTGLNVSAQQLHANMTKIGAALGGAAMIYGGVKMLGLFEKMVSAGDVLVSQQNKMRLAGDSNRQVVEATAKAYAASARLGVVSATGAMEIGERLRASFGAVGADKLLDTVVKAQTILRAELGPGAGSQAFDLVQAARLRTADPAEADRLIKIMTAGVEASRGTMTGSMYQRTLLTARNAGLNLSDEFLDTVLPATAKQFALAGNAARGGVGPSISNAYTNMFAKGLPMKGQAARTALQLGLVGSVRGGTNDVLTGSSLFNKNPYEWVQQVLVPSLAAHKIQDPELIKRIITQLAGNAAVAQLFTSWALHGRAAEGAASPYGQHAQVPGLDDNFRMLMANDLPTNMAAFNAQWDTMMTAFGAPMVPMAVVAMRNITKNVIGPLGRFAQIHPDAMVALGGALTATAVALVAIGGSALIVAAVGTLGALPALLIGLATALAVLYAVFPHGAGPATPRPDGRMGSGTARYPGTVAPYGPESLPLIRGTRLHPGDTYGAPLHFTIGDIGRLSSNVGAAPASGSGTGGDGLDAGGAPVNYFQSHGGQPGPGVVIQTPFGPAHVNPAAVDDATGYFNRLKELGVPINSIGSYANRGKRYGRGLSSHAYSGAWDLNNQAGHLSPEITAWLAASSEHREAWVKAQRDFHMREYMPKLDPNHIEWTGPGGVAAGAAAAGGGDVGGRGSWFGNYLNWRDPMSGPKTASGQSMSVPGIALPNRKTLGKMFTVRTPDGRTFTLPQTDVGPAPWTGRAIDINSAAAARMGYSPRTFPTNGRFGAVPVGNSSVWETGAAAIRSGGGLWDSIPNMGRQLHEHHTTLLLDGRVVAKSTMKHMIGMGNHKTGSGVMADYSGTRPLSV